MLQWNAVIQRLFEIYGTATQKELAEMLDVTPALVSRWLTDNPKEKRCPTWKTLCKVIEDKCVTWDWLLEGRGPKYWEQPTATPDE